MTTNTLSLRLYEMSQDLWWTGDPWANDVFQSLDPVRWEELNHNPCALLSEYQSGSFTAPSRKWLVSANAIIK